MTNRVKIALIAITLFSLIISVFLVIHLFNLRRNIDQEVETVSAESIEEMQNRIDTLVEQNKELQDRIMLKEADSNETTQDQIYEVVKDFTHVYHDVECYQIDYTYYHARSILYIADNLATDHYIRSTWTDGVEDYRQVAPQTYQRRKSTLYKRLIQGMSVTVGSVNENLGRADFSAIYYKQWYDVNGQPSEGGWEVIYGAVVYDKEREKWLIDEVYDTVQLNNFNPSNSADLNVVWQKEYDNGRYDYDYKVEKSGYVFE